MIWSSFSSLVLVDLTIVGLAVFLLVNGIVGGRLKKGRWPRTGRYLIVAGLVTTALYYLADLVSVTIVPRLSGPISSMAVIEFLQHNVRVPATLVSYALILAGAIFVIRGFSEAEESLRRSDKKIIDAEAKLRERARFRQTEDEISSRLHSLPDDRPGNTIRECLRQACIYVGADHIALVWFDLEHHRANLLYFWGRYGQPPWAELSGDGFPWIPDPILRGEIVAIDAVSDMRGDAMDKQLLLTPGLKSVAGIPLVVGGEVVGTCNFATTVAEKTWSKNELQEMQVLSNLLANVVNRLTLHRSLQNRDRFQQAVADIASRLISAPNDRIDGALKDCLEMACNFAKVDRLMLSWFDGPDDGAKLLSFWTERGEQPVIDIRMNQFPWIAERISRGETVAVASIASMPDTIADKQIVSDLGLKSFAVIPLVVAGDVVGICGYGTIEAERGWREQDLQDMQVVSNLLSDVVSRLRGQESLDAALAEINEAKERLEAENVYLRHEIKSTHEFNELVGESVGLINCLQQVAQVAPTHTTVLVQGETGTGKELIARAIHERSNRRERPLVAVNCAALPANLIESELFGHEKGAFTGADSRKRGRFDIANGGTLFLDEIGDLPLDLQGKLLRVLQDGEFDRLGGTDTISVDVRIIAATNRALQEAVDSGDFRADLFYRINTFPIMLPALRERKDDIPILAEHFVAKHSASLGKEVSGVSSAMMTQLQAFSWPGNVRELESVVQRALISADGPILQLAGPLQEGASASAAFTMGTLEHPLDLREAQKGHIAFILEQTGWKIAGPGGAADKLGIPPSTLRSKMKKLGIERRA